jgi:hypothetical protein
VVTLQNAFIAKEFKPALLENASGSPVLGHRERRDLSETNIIKTMP